MIDALPLERVAGVIWNRAVHPDGCYAIRRFGKLSTREASMLRKAFGTIAIEIEHAIEEGRQNAIASESDEELVIRMPRAKVSFDEIERQAINGVLRLTGGHQAAAADLLGVSDRTINYKMEQLGIRRAYRERVVA